MMMLIMAYLSREAKTILNTGILIIYSQSVHLFAEDRLIFSYIFGHPVFLMAPNTICIRVYSLQLTSPPRTDYPSD